MNLNISEHIEYNQYKEKLNEIYDKLDEVIYLSNTIDYKKITILLAEIVQNFDYYKYYEEALATAATKEADQPTATEATEATEATVGGGKEPDTSQPYSKIDYDEKTIDNIKGDDEYSRLTEYISNTTKKIGDKGDKLKELVNTFLKTYFKQLNNNKITDDYIKQYSNLIFKLDDIISNINKINSGTKDVKTADAKIYVDLMSNEWRFKWRHNSAENVLDEFVGMWYRCCKKPFVKNIHVMNMSQTYITTQIHNEFKKKLFKLYVKLHGEFPKPAISTDNFNEIKKNLKQYKADEADKADKADKTPVINKNSDRTVEEERDTVLQQRKTDEAASYIPFINENRQDTPQIKGLINSTKSLTTEANAEAAKLKEDATNSIGNIGKFFKQIGKDVGKGRVSKTKTNPADILSRV